MWTTCKPCKESGPWRDHSPRIPDVRILEARVLDPRILEVWRQDPGCQDPRCQGSGCQGSGCQDPGRQDPGPRPGSVLVGAETGPRTEFGPQEPRTHARVARPQSGWRLSVSGEATPPRLQGGARLRPASPCGRERDGVSEQGVRPQRSGGRALPVACRAPGTLAIRPLGWRPLPLYTRRHHTLRDERNRRGGPSMRP